MDAEKYFCTQTDRSIRGHFKTVQDMVAQLQPIVRESLREPVYFRGQVYPWRLVSSLHRSPTPDIDIRETAKFMEWLRSSPYVVKDKAKMEDNVLMSVAQHYGYKTDLIDFTTDLEVAAYFATDFQTFAELPDNACGCIWCISKDDISNLQEIFWEEVGRGTVTDKQVMEAFRENENSPFFHYDFPGLSRIQNQRGIFLWDYHGLFTTYYFGGPDCTFAHTEPHAYLTERIHTGFIYPEPNALEREIERYVYPRNCSSTAESAEFKNLIAKCIQIEKTPISAQYGKLSDMLEEQLWEDAEWKKMDKHHLPNHDIYRQRIHSLPARELEKMNQELCMELVNEYFQALEEGYLLHFECGCAKLGAVINEVVSTLRYYPYTREQTAECLYHTVQLAQTALQKFQREYGVEYSGALHKITGWISREKVAQEAYQDSVIELEFMDEAGVSSRGYVPQYFFIDGKKSYKKKQVQTIKAYAQETKTRLPGALDARALLQMVTNPRKLLDFEDVCQLFTKYLLPSQFLFRSKEGRIYTPVFVVTLGLA